MVVYSVITRVRAKVGGYLVITSNNSNLRAVNSKSLSLIHQLRTLLHQQRTAIRHLLDFVSTLPLDADASDRAAETWRLLESKGERIGMADCLIAGIALQHGVSLLTRNRQHFSRVPDLVLA